VIVALGWSDLPLSRAANFTKGRAVAPFTPEFKPGDYIWDLEVSPAGPVVVIVSLSEQRIYVYRNGVRIGRSAVSTGTRGHTTPPLCSLFCRRK
jgi:hypothetical protein